MTSDTVMAVTGSSKGIGRYLSEYYLKKGFSILGLDVMSSTLSHTHYRHLELDVSDEISVKNIFSQINRDYQKLDILINNAGVASMNHSLLTPGSVVNKIFRINFLGTFLCCREAAKIMKKNKFGRIINFVSIATPLKLAGEAIYASSKAAVLNLTQILGKEFADFGITMNAIGPAPVKTDLIKNIPEKQMNYLLSQQSINRFSEFDDISNVIDFFIHPKSNFITGQVIYLGGIS